MAPRDQLKYPRDCFKRNLPIDTAPVIVNIEFIRLVFCYESAEAINLAAFTGIARKRQIEISL